jgi:hypothetical protein
MDLLKTPHQLLMEEAGAHIDGGGLLDTPKQKLFEEVGAVPKFAKGKKVISPEDMKAELFVQKTMPKPTATHPELAKVWNNLFK